MSATTKAGALAVMDDVSSLLGEHHFNAAANRLLDVRATVAMMAEALRKSEATLSGSLKARGYQTGSTVALPTINLEVRTLAEVRAALASFHGEQP